MKLLLARGANRSLNDGMARNRAQYNGHDHCVALLDTFFPRETLPLLLGVELGTRDAASAPIARHPLFDRNVLELVLCFSFGRECPAFDALQADADALRNDEDDDDDDSASASASASSRPSKKAKLN